MFIDDIIFEISATTTTTTTTTTTRPTTTTSPTTTSVTTKLINRKYVYVHASIFLMLLTL